MHAANRTRRALATLVAAAACGTTAHATEGALGRPVTGTSVTPNAGVVPPAPIFAVNLGQIYLDGDLKGSRPAPIAGEVSAGIDGKVAFTLATFMKVWDTHTGPWNFASSITLPYLYTKVKASFSAGPLSGNREDSASNLFDLYFTPLIAGFHISKTEHIALSVNIWAPTGKYDASQLANTSLNNWTYIPQVAYTAILPQQSLQFDVTAGMQFYTKNKDTDYKNAPLFTLDAMVLKRFRDGLSAGLIVGTTQQIGHDSGPTADRLGGFRGWDWALGPIVTWDTKVSGEHPLSMSLRWVPTISSHNRLDSTATVMGTVTVVF